MTVGEFAEAVEQMRRRHGGSVTSWGRSDARSVAVGGFIGDPHTWGLGADIIWSSDPPLPLLEVEARTLGLKLLREPSRAHDHVQPLDFPAGPVTEYDGETKTWS